MPILFGTLWKDAVQFNNELIRLKLQPLEGELRVWWVIFRNVQVDLQINAQTLNKAKYLTLQEWAILAAAYTTAKEFYKTSVADLIKQKMSASFTSFSAAEPLVVDEKTKEYLIGKNINENDIQRGLIQFINSLDLHFYNLARISPVNKLLREYRSRIGLIMPLYDQTNEINPPTYGSPPIYVSPEGAIELLYDDESLGLDAEGRLGLIGRGANYSLPLYKNETEHDTTISLLFDETLKVDLHGKLGIKNVLTFTEPLRLTNNTEVSLGYEAPLFETGEHNLGVKIDNRTIILNDNNQLEAVASTPRYASPLYLNVHDELTLNYTPVFSLNEQQQLDLSISKPLIFDSNHDLAIDYSGGITMLNSKLQLNLETETPYTINNRQELGFGYDETLFKINENKFDYKTIPYINEQTFRGPFVINASTPQPTPPPGYNAKARFGFVHKFNLTDTDSRLNYKGLGVLLTDGELQANWCMVTLNDGTRLDSVQALGVSHLLKSKINTSYTDAIANKKAIVNLDTTTISNTHEITKLKAETASLTTKEEAIHDVLNELRADVDKNTNNLVRLKYTNQLLSQINNRLTILKDTSKCSDEILHQGRYRFQNKIQPDGIRNDNLVQILPNKKVVNVKGSFFIQHNFAGYKFATFKLDKFQKYSFATHHNNLYYATYTGYFSTTMANPIYLRIYQEGNWLKYYLWSQNVSGNQGYNIECDYQVIACDSQDNNRTTWNLITGDVFLNEVEWKYKLPNNLKLTPTATISLTWIYEGHLYTSSTFRVNYGHWESFYLNGHSGAGWDFKIIDKYNFSVKSADTQPLIQNIQINLV